MPPKKRRQQQQHSEEEKQSKKKKTQDDEEAKGSDVDSTSKSKRQLRFDEDVDDTRNYWLLKSEPNSRFVNGVDVKFSLTDLMSAEEQTTCWDGVRNMEARNNMRKMKTGDLAFFYHSNCRDPGIAGLVQIVKEAYPDHTQFDSENPHFDAKSTSEEPRWDMVDVKFVRRLKRFISLSEIRKYYVDHTSNNGPLMNVGVITRKRLSVQPVTKTEFDFILDLESKME